MTTATERFTTRGDTTSGSRTALLAVGILSAALMAVSGAIHLHLWNEYYRHITVGHMNVLFMVQLIAAFLGAAALLVWRRWIVFVASAALMLGTAVGYLIARYHSGGLFGFYLGPHFSSSDAIWSLIVEFVAAATLAVGATLAIRGSHGSA